MRNFVTAFVLLCALPMANADEPVSAAPSTCPGGFVTWTQGSDTCRGVIVSSQGITGHAQDNGAPTIGVADFICRVTTATWVETAGFCANIGPT